MLTLLTCLQWSSNPNLPFGLYGILFSSILLLFHHDLLLAWMGALDILKFQNLKCAFLVQEVTL